MPLIEPLKFRKSGSTVVAPAEMEPGDQIPGAYVSDIAMSNLLINGDMRINQRVFAGGALAAAAFGYDNWFADTGGANISVSAAGVITHASGTICQAVEAPRGAFGVAVTVSVGDLSGGNLTVNVGGNTGTITSGSGRRYVTLTAPASSGTGNLVVKLAPASAAVTYREIAVVRGGDMAGFEYRPQAIETMLAQRYYAKSFPASVAPAQNSGVWDGASAYVAYFAGAGVVGAAVKLPTTMRASPALLFFNPVAANANWRNRNLGVDGAAGATAYNIVNPDGFVIINTQVAAYQVGNTSFIHWVADAGITS
ncbi:hypothetical protein ACW0US_07020 [Xanthomonas euvesicatoria]